ncbi:hypothetical protein [Nocardia huaxiensis]|uniref:hypothetical protein n=1 Tax=Nocardia huaxiensis TaxID=2755382 RepID=UPI001E427D95|nr:hypothetical protein [Nocardia huaxiensis]UFS95389.1 hypothetical protein LPY97_32680 [Nocardia huaxiensis]
MPEKFGGKIFYTREEGEALGLIPSDEELARARKAFDEFNERRRNLPPAPVGETPGYGGRFSDDLEGTEFEGWTQAASGQWVRQGRTAGPR